MSTRTDRVLQSTAATAAWVCHSFINYYRKSFNIVSFCICFNKYFLSYYINLPKALNGHSARRAETCFHGLQVVDANGGSTMPITRYAHSAKAISRTSVCSWNTMKFPESMILFKAVHTKVVLCDVSLLLLKTNM